MGSRGIPRQDWAPHLWGWEELLETVWLRREGSEDSDVGEVPGRVPSQVEGGEDDGGAGNSDQVEAKHRQLAVKSPHIAGAKTGLSPRPPVVSLQVPGLGQEEEEDVHELNLFHKG